MFYNRDSAAQMLADRLKGLSYKNPVVLGIPRGGVVLATIIARSLNADLDVLLARKISSQDQPEFAIGSVSEDGEVYVYNKELTRDAFFEREKNRQFEEIKLRRSLIRQITEKVSLHDRSVIITDDGIATGSTLIAGLHAVYLQKPYEVIVATPVAPPGTLQSLSKLCDEIICIDCPENFRAIGQFYQQFDQVSDFEMLKIIKDFKQYKQKIYEKDTKKVDILN